MRAHQVVRVAREREGSQDRILDAAYRDVGRRLEANTAVSVDEKGRLHVESLELLNALAQIADLVKQHQRLLLGSVSASSRDPSGILTPKLHAP